MTSYIQPIKFYVKNFVAFSLYYSGILLLLKRLKLRNRTIVITYHRVLPEDAASESFSSPGIIVRPETFAEHIKYLKKHFNIVPSTEIKTADSSLKKNYTCVITFDDGWIDNYLYALPVITNYDVPVTLFLPVDYIGTGRLFWQEETARMLFSLFQSDKQRCRELLDSVKISGVLVGNKSTLRSEILSIVSRLKRLPYSEINRFVETLRTACREEAQSDHIDRYIDWEQARIMQEHGVYLGSHACSHRILTRLDADEIDKELVTSATTIEAHTGTRPLTIAYPNGDSDEIVQKSARNAGYTAGFTTRSGYVDQADNEYSLNRINMHQQKTYNKPMLLMALLGYI